MQNFHYVRELVGEGLLHRRSNAARGFPLREVIQYPIPLGINLLIYAGIADAVNDAHNNGIVHGDLSIDDIYLTENAVIIDGFGRTRTHSKAPEGYPQGPKTDVYGLGIILFALLSDNPNFTPQFGPEYEKHIVHALLNLNWGELGEQAWLENIQTFFVTAVHETPEERPEALDIANISLSLVEHCHNSDYSFFAAQFESMNVSSSEDQFEPDPETEDLDGPSSVQGIDLFDDLEIVPDSAQGAATGLWSREAIAKIYQEEPQPEPQYSHQQEPQRFNQTPEQPPFQQESPVPMHNDAFGFQGDQEYLDEPENFHSQNSIHSVAMKEPGNQTFNDFNYPGNNQQNNAFNQQKTDPQISQSNEFIHSTPDFTREPTVEERPNFQEPSGGSKKIIIGAIAAVFLLLIGGAGAFVLLSEDTTSSESEEKTDSVQKDEKIEKKVIEDTGDGEEPPPKEEPKEEPKKEVKKPVKPKKTVSNTSKPTTKPKSKPKPPPKKETQPRTVATVQKELRVSLSVASNSDAIARCKDGQTRTFSGQTQFTFPKSTKCLIEIDGAKGFARMKKSGAVHCRVSGSSVLCK